MTQRLDTGQARAQRRSGRGDERAKRRRRLRKLIISLLVLIGLLVATDFGLAAAAEYQVSKKMREQLGLNEDPEVQIHGFPFITQALRGDYSHVSVSASDVPVEDRLRDLAVFAELYDIRIGLSDLLSGKANKARIDNVDGMVKIRSSDISRLLGIPDLEITPASMRYVLSTEHGDNSLDGKNDNPGVPDDGDTPATSDPLERNEKTAGVRLSGSLNIAGAKTKVTSYGVISLVGNKIKIVPKKLEFSNSSISANLPEPLQSTILKHFAVTLDPGDLPFTVTPKAVGAEPGAVSLSGHIDDVRLNGSGENNGR